MHIKRFEGASMEAALARVREELGPDALILSSRTLRRGHRSFGLLSRSSVEVQAAVERGSAASTEVPGVLPADLDPEIERWQARDRFEREIREELGGLREALGRMSRGSRVAPSDGIAETLERAGLDSSVSDALATEWEERREVESGGDWTDVLLDRLEQRCEPPREVVGGGVRMLVGAPGVGKTTTLAKLAGRNEEGERDVALVSLDHFRIGATDQLRRYAELLDSPFVEAAKAEEIGALAGRYAGFEILVDTAGRGRHADDRMMGLEPLREQLGGAARVELVIDATVRPELQRSQLRRFAPLVPDRVVLTKTDECENLASLANLMLDPLCPPVCWRGSGQRVPEDLVAVDAGAIVRDVLEAAA